MTILETVGFTWLVIGVSCMIIEAGLGSTLALWVGLPEAVAGIALIYKGDPRHG